MTDPCTVPLPLLKEASYWNQFFTPAAAFQFCDQPPTGSTLELALISLLDQQFDGYAHGYDRSALRASGGRVAIPVYQARTAAPADSAALSWTFNLQTLGWMAAHGEDHEQWQDFPSLLQLQFRLSRRTAWDAAVALVAAAVSGNSYLVVRLCKALKSKIDGTMDDASAERSLREWINHALGRRVK